MATQLTKWEAKMVGFWLRAWKEGGARKGFERREEAEYAKFMLYRALNRALGLGGEDVWELERVKEEVSLRLEGTEVVAYMKGEVAAFAAFEEEEAFETEGERATRALAEKLFKEQQERDDGKGDGAKWDGGGAKEYWKEKGEREGAKKVGMVSQVDAGSGGSDRGREGDTVGRRAVAGGVARGGRDAEGTDGGLQSDARENAGRVYSGEGAGDEETMEKVSDGSATGRGCESAGEIGREKGCISDQGGRGEGKGGSVDEGELQAKGAGTVGVEIQPGVGGVPSLRELMRREWERQQQEGASAEEILARHSKDS